MARKVRLATHEEGWVLFGETALDDTFSWLAGVWPSDPASSIHFFFPNHTRYFKPRVPEAAG